MSPNRQNSNILFFLCLLTGTLALLFSPVSRLDTFAFKAQVKALQNGDIQTYQKSSSYLPPKYLVCSIDDDEEDITNHGIYHPLELAVSINGLKKLGTRHLFLGTHLHWPELEKKENAVLNTAISELDSCIISVPLRRSASPVSLPTFLRETSISTSQVLGNLNTLPKVNNLSLSPTFDIPKNTLTGFSQLETELPSTKLPLLAYWEDRVVLSSLLLERMHHLRISSDELEVELGKHIKLGHSGNIIPIDEYGYFTPTSYPTDRKPDLLSSYVTSIEKSPVKTDSAILTAEGLQADNYRAINQPAIQLEQLTLTPVLKKGHTSTRLHSVITILALIAVAYFLGYTSPLPPVKYLIWVMLLCLFWVAVAMILVRKSGFYLPMTHLVVAILTACLCYFILKWRTRSLNGESDDFINFDTATEAFTANKRAKAEAKIAKKNYKLALKQQKRARRLKKREDNLSDKQEQPVIKEQIIEVSDLAEDDDFNATPKDESPDQSDN